MKNLLRLRTAAATLTLLAFTSLANAATSYTIDSLDGDITPNETAKFIASVNTLTPNVNNWGNNMADHASGTACEGIRRMYEATHNLTILNQYIKFCDVFLAHRNDQPAGEHRVMWDGSVDHIWPSVVPTDPLPTYCGCESGQVAGHVVYCAWLILDNPSIWNQIVPDGNRNNYGITYKQRAQKYLAMVDDTLAQYFTRWFVDPSTHRIRKPKDPRWATLSGGSSCTAWNRQMMFVLPYDYAARCHDILGDNPSFLPLYKSVVNQFASWFVSSATYYTANGHAVAKWVYEIPPDTHLENIGHAQHDVVGLFESYESQYTGVSSAQIKIFADTTQFVINLGTTDSWAGNVDGTGSSTSLKTDFIFLAQWNRPLYKMIAQSNIDAKQINNGSEACKNTGYILYMKHWIFTHNFSGNYKIIARNSGKSLLVQNASTANNAPIVQDNFGGAPTNDEWQLIDLSGGYYQLKNTNSAKAAVVANASSSNGAPIIQYTYGGIHTNDEWRLDDTGAGYFRLWNHYSGKVLEIAKGSSAVGAPADQSQWLQSPQQQFQIISVP